MAGEVFCIDALLMPPQPGSVPLRSFRKIIKSPAWRSREFFLQARRALPRNLTAACLFPYKKHRVCL